VDASLIGRQLGQYEVLARLGRGQHSVVYKAWQKNLERYVTLKVLYRCDEATRHKLQEEALLTADLIQRGAPNIRQIYEVGQTADGYLFVALEYVEGSLHSVMERVRRGRRLVDSAAAARLLMPVAQALDAVHSMGWVHLDIKPQNILISSMGRAMLADFGIARRRGMHTRACTPLYASPEQADGDRPVGPWSDIYSLGVVLYEMVTGRPPFQAELDLVILNKHLTEAPPPPRKLNDRLSARQERAILKALSKAPADRPRTANELLQNVLPTGGLVSGIAATSSGVLRRTAGWTRRLPRLVLGGALIVLILAVLLLVAWAMWPLLAPGAPATATPIASPTVEAPAVSEPTRQPTLTPTPSATVWPTSTLAPTPTHTPRPRPTRTPRPVASATGTAGAGP
jgi:serine/threonine-protein kinase